MSSFYVIIFKFGVNIISLFLSPPLPPALFHWFLNFSVVFPGYLQEKRGIKYGIYASGVSLISCGVLFAIIGIQQAVQRKLKEKKTGSGTWYHRQFKIIFDTVHSNCIYEMSPYKLQQMYLHGRAACNNLFYKCVTY